MEPQLQRLENPLSINALNALRDGASCSDTMGCGGYVGAGRISVKGRLVDETDILALLEESSLLFAFL